MKAKGKKKKKGRFKQNLSANLTKSEWGRGQSLRLHLGEEGQRRGQDGVGTGKGAGDSARRCRARRRLLSGLVGLKGSGLRQTARETYQNSNKPPIFTREILVPLRDAQHQPRAAGQPPGGEPCPCRDRPMPGPGRERGPPPSCPRHML